MVMTGSGPHQTSPHQTESANVCQQDRENYQEGSMHTIHMDGSGFQRKGHAAHEQGDEKAM